jgi:amidase
MADDFSAMSGLELGRLVRSGELDPVELLEGTIERIEAINPTLNAVIHKLYDEARKVANYWRNEVVAGRAQNVPFCGVPFLLKDLLAEYKGAPFNEGCRALAGNVSKINSELVIRQKAAGLVVCGKTNTPEFGGSPVTEPTLHGVTVNPWNIAHTPGGSSGGSAAMVAAGVVPMAHANDGGGSIRIPASCCGLFGMKPTRGRNPLGPLFGDLGNGIIYEHVVSRSVADSAALLDATAGPNVGDPYYAPAQEGAYLDEVSRDPGRLKLGFITQLPAGWHETTQPHDDCVVAVENTAQLCASLGHNVEQIDADTFAHPDMPALFGPRFSAFVGHVIAFWEEQLGRKMTHEDMEDSTWDWYQQALNTNAAQYLRAVEDAQRYSRAMENWYLDGGYDALIMPTLAVPPVKIGAFNPDLNHPGQWLHDILNFVAFTYVYNLTGQPAMSVPLYNNANGLPIGVQFAGRFGDEAGLFRLASQLEVACPWADRRPPIHCANL